jgi:hypothetical protein
MEEHDRWVAPQNVERFNTKLATEKNPAKRKVLQELLERELERQRRD